MLEWEEWAEWEALEVWEEWELSAVKEPQEQQEHKEPTWTIKLSTLINSANSKEWASQTSRQTSML